MPPVPAVRSSSTLDLRTVTPDSPITIACGDGEITMSVKNVIEWVAPGAPIQDAMRFLLVCRNLKLNPLIGEAFLLPMGKTDTKYQVIFPKSAYLKKAQEHAEYDGHESGVTVWFKGDFMDVAGLIRPPVDGLAVVGGWAKVWRKGVSRPVYKRVSLDEYRKGTHIWGAIPNTMIAKVALVAALREAFNLSDGYDESEADTELPRPRFVSQPAPATIDVEVERATAPAVSLALPDHSDGPKECRTDDAIGYSAPWLIAQLNRLADEVGLTYEQFVAVLSRRNVNSIEDLTIKQAEEIIARLEERIRDKQATEVFGPPAAPDTPSPEAEATPENPASIVLPEMVCPEGKPS